jgi:hypothetical protein
MVNRRHSQLLLSSSVVARGEVREVPLDVVLLSGPSSASWQRLDKVTFQVSATRNDDTEVLGNLFDTAFLMHSSHSIVTTGSKVYHIFGQ